MNFNKKAIIAASGNKKSTGWELDNAVLPNYLNVGNQTPSSNGLYFSPDGINLYIAGETAIYQYVLSTAWLVSSATYTRSFSYGSNTPVGVHFSTDGTKMFLITPAHIVVEYTASTPWNISTLTEIRTYNGYAYDITCQDLFFSADGTKLYTIGSANKSINQFSLGSAWSLSSVTYVQSFSVSSQEAVPTSVFFRVDGIKMYVMGASGDDINEYDLSTAWDISTASFVRSSGTTPEATTGGLFFKSDGSVVYFVGNSLDLIYTYIATTPWNVSTLKTKNFYRVLVQEATPSGIHFSTDGTKMYVIGQIGDDINQYSLSTPWDVQTATYEKLFSIAVQETTPNALFFSTDGTNMYVMGSSGDDVNQYSLSTPWDIATASYVRIFSVGGQETAPTGLYFSPDGTRMYVVGSTGDDINQYDLVVPWNVGTASYVRVSPSGLDAIPTGIFFKPDGTRFYFYGYNSDILWSYNLTTPWDVSTLVYYQQLSLKPLEEIIQDIYFKPDGTMLYAVGSVIDAVYAIELN